MHYLKKDIKKMTYTCKRIVAILRNYSDYNAEHVHTMKWNQEDDLFIYQIVQSIAERFGP